MNLKKLRYLPLVLLLVGFAILLWWLTKGHTVAILQPRGEVASRQKSILVFAFLLSMVVIIPVYILTFFIVWRYRADNKKAAYTPDWDHSRRLETIWWAIPCAIILILSVVTWQTSHSLDPFKPLASSKPQMTIQVIALQWKWLFIYPDQRIATVNYVRIPVGTPIDFKVTADAPMNSFWIPQLGSQIYAMPGMSTEVHLIADSAGTYQGSSANISGTGFADMHFTAEAVSQTDFASWVRQTAKDPHALNDASYAALANPVTKGTRSQYGNVNDGLYDNIVMKYVTPAEPASQNTAVQPEQTQTAGPVNGAPAHAW